MPLLGHQVQCRHGTTEEHGASSVEIEWEREWNGPSMPFHGRNSESQEFIYRPGVGPFVVMLAPC